MAAVNLAVLGWIKVKSKSSIHNHLIMLSG